MGTFDHVVIKSTLRVMLISLVRTCIPSSSLLNVTAAINSSFVCKRGGGVLTPVLLSVGITAHITDSENALLSSLSQCWSSSPTLLCPSVRIISSRIL